MSGSLVTCPSAGFARRPAGAVLRERIDRIAASVIEEWRLRRDLAQLQGMDARGLHDIGLTRGSLEGAVRHGRRISRDVPETIRAAPEWPAMPASWTEWR